MKRNFTHFSLVALLFPLVSLSQLPSGAPANFGVDGDIRSDARLVGSFTAAGTHDWFKTTGGSGIGVVDTTGASTLKTQLAAGANLSFTRGMSVAPYSVWNGSLMIDTRYGRDYFAYSNTMPTSDLTTFTLGAKNGDNPTVWPTLPLGAAAQDKVDIIDAYVHMRRNGTVITGANPSHLMLVLGATTVSNNGNRYFDAEFFCSSVTYNPATGLFANTGNAATGGHTTWQFYADGSIKQFGDMSVSFSFSGSGVSETSIWIWVTKATYQSLNPTAFDFVSGEFYGSTAVATYGYAKIKPNTGSLTAWGAVNSAVTAGPPWATNSKTIGNSSVNYYSVNYDKEELGEAAVDLTSIGIDPALIGNSPCAPPFSSVLFKSRSSSSFNSALSDFTGPYPFMGNPIASAAIQPPQVLTCTNTAATLQPATYLAGASYTWSTSDGHIVGRTDTAFITIDKPGNYTLNAAVYPGCTVSTESAAVNIDTYKPEATAYTLNNLNPPTVTQAALVGGDTAASKYSNSYSSYQGLTWAWTGPNSFSSSVQNPTVTSAGSYTLIVTQISNGCKDTALTAVFNGTISLATQYTNFKAKKLETAAVQLSWTTSGDFGMGYQILRSTDGQHFQPVSFVASNKATQLYHYTDNISDVTTPQVYYQLRIVDPGTGKYSEIVSIKNNLSANSKLSIAPNPVNDRTIVSFQAFARGESRIEIIDLSGRVVKQHMLSTKAGINNVELNRLENIPAGVYTIRVITGNTIFTQRMLKIASR